MKEKEDNGVKRPRGQADRRGAFSVLRENPPFADCRKAFEVL